MGSYSNFFIFLISKKVDCASTYGSISCLGFQSEKEGDNPYSANYIFHSRIEIEFTPSYPPESTDF